MKVYILITSIDYENSTIIKGVYSDKEKAMIKKSEILKEFAACSNYYVEYFDEIWIEDWEII